MQLEIPEGCGVGQRCWKSPQSSVKSLVCGLLGRGGGVLGVLEYPVEWVAMKTLSIIYVWRSSDVTHHLEGNTEIGRFFVQHCVILKCHP